MNVCGITRGFPRLSPAPGQVAHVLRTRPPRKGSEEPPARLACIRHAASVDPEPGSNSPPMPRRADASAEAPGAPKSAPDPAGPFRPRDRPKSTPDPLLRVMATRLHCWLFSFCCDCAVDEFECVLTPGLLSRGCRAQARSARSVFGTRRDGPVGSVSLQGVGPRPPSAAPACQRAHPRSGSAPNGGIPTRGHDRPGTDSRRSADAVITASPSRPPVLPRGGRPSRSPQSLPYPPAPCQGTVT